MTRLGTDDRAFSHLQEGIRERVAPLDRVHVQSMIRNFDFTDIIGGGKTKRCGSLRESTVWHSWVMAYPADFPGAIKVLRPIGANLGDRTRKEGGKKKTASRFVVLSKNISYKRTRRNDMPDQKHHTRTEEISQELEGQDDWTKEVVPRLPAHLEEQAKKLKAFERCREISSATDLLRGLLAYVYTAHSFQHLSMWSVLIGLADVSANAWRKHLRKASEWLDWLLQDVLAMAEPLSPWLMRGGLKRILLIDGTHWKCFGPQGIVMRVHTAFDLLAGRLTQGIRDGLP